MIPYFDQPTLSLGPLTIHAFGALVATAVLLGSEIIRYRVRKEGLDPQLATRMVTWILVSGFIGAHLVDRFIYFPGETLQDPLSIIMIWKGISSFGGFLGAIVGIWLFLRRGEMGKDKWRYVDAVAYAFPIAWIFGRAGCFLAFDHPGSETTFWLAQTYRDGVVRHNLGLDEAIFTVGWAALVVILGRKKRFPGFFVALLPITYMPFRFFLDYLRKVDVRYFGLTPGQYGAIALMVVGIFLFRYLKRRSLAAAES